MPRPDAKVKSLSLYNMAPSACPVIHLSGCECVLCWSLSRSMVLCLCGCGRIPDSGSYASSACRKRVDRLRKYPRSG